MVSAARSMRRIGVILGSAVGGEVVFAAGERFTGPAVTTGGTLGSAAVELDAEVS